MPSFSKDCFLAKQFVSWLQSPGGGGKSLCQSHQLCVKLLKYAKFCCDDVDTTWDVPQTVMDYCIGSVVLLGEFIKYLQEKWKIRYSGTIRLHERNFTLS